MPSAGASPVQCPAEALSIARLVRCRKQGPLQETPLQTSQHRLQVLATLQTQARTGATCCPQARPYQGGHVAWKRPAFFQSRRPRALMHLRWPLAKPKYMRPSGPLTSVRRPTELSACALSGRSGSCGCANAVSSSSIASAVR